MKRHQNAFTLMRFATGYPPFDRSKYKVEEKLYEPDTDLRQLVLTLEACARATTARAVFATQLSPSNGRTKTQKTRPYLAAQRIVAL